MAKHKKSNLKSRLSQSEPNRAKFDKTPKTLNIRERMVKFTGFCIVALREMAYTFTLVYKKFYSKDSLEDIMSSSFADQEEYNKIVCSICDREFSNNDAVVKCPEKGCDEIYHYICWHFSHGCTRPGCLASLENPRNLIIH